MKNKKQYRQARASVMATIREVEKSSLAWRPAFLKLWKTFQSDTTAGEVLMREGLMYLIRRCSSRRRTEVMVGSDPPSVTTVAGLRVEAVNDLDPARLAARTSAGPYSFPLMGGFRLGEADIEMLHDEIVMRRRNLETNRVKVEWLERIADKLMRSSAVRVYEAFTEQELIQIQNEAVLV